MNSLILIAHGSRVQQSNDEVRSLTNRLRQLIGDRYAQVECAFLELAQPSIPDAIDCMVAHHCKHVVLLPYFLASGSHVASHIPEIVQGKQAEHPDVRLDLLPHLGQAQGLVEFLTRLV